MGKQVVVPTFRIAYVACGHTFIFSWRKGRTNEMRAHICSLAADPKVKFYWRDCRFALEKIEVMLEEADRRLQEKP